MINRIIIIIALKLHNLSYRVAAIFSRKLEANDLHPKHRLMKYHDWFCARVKHDWNVLDIGCGNGALAYDVKDHCARIFAVDLNPKNIETAKKHTKQAITYLCADATIYTFQDKFDAIILSNVLEHIEDRVGLLKRIYQNQDQTKPPLLLLRVPMITRDWITLYKKEMGVEWRLDKTHFTEYTHDQVHDELRQAGLKVIEHTVQFGEFYGVVIKA
jgi:SAM-dependent methyltransferase